MATGIPRIPRADSNLNTYINSTTKHLLKADAAFGTNWQRLGLTAEEKDQWVAYNDEWNTAWQTVLTNRSGGISDSNATFRKNEARKKFTKWVTDSERNKLNRIGASANVTDNDRIIFHIKVRDKTLTARAQITEAPLVDFKVQEGGDVLINCREKSDSNRTSMHPLADVVEMKYIYVTPGDSAPATPNECTHTELSSKALFRFSAGMKHSGKRMFAFMRWRNNAEPAKSGPWSTIKTIIISD
jgi:hypothetical protein